MAWDDMVKVSGIPELSVTQRTNVLVIGDINPAVLAPAWSPPERPPRRDPECPDQEERSFPTSLSLALVRLRGAFGG